MTTTDKQLRNRAEVAKRAIDRANEARLQRNAVILRAVNEGRTKAEVARATGLTKPMIAKIAARATADANGVER